MKLMAFATRSYFLLYVWMLSLAAFCIAQDLNTSCSRATYYSSPDGLGTPNGACGLRELGRKIYHAKVSGVSSRLYLNGKGCGTCYQVRCKDPKYCSEKGTKVFVTDYGEGDGTDFILSHRAYAALGGGEAAAEHLFAAGVVDVDYRRIDCGIPGDDSIAILDEERSDLPNYIAIWVLYQGAHQYVEGVDLVTFEDGKLEKTPMRRAYGAVWDLANHPNFTSWVYINLSNQTGLRLMQIENVLPSNWKSGIDHFNLKHPLISSLN